MQIDSSDHFSDKVLELPSLIVLRDLNKHNKYLTCYLLEVIRFGKMGKTIHKIYIEGRT